MQMFTFSLRPTIQMNLVNQMGYGTLWQVYPEFNTDLQIWELNLTRA